MSLIYLMALAMAAQDAPLAEPTAVPAQAAEGRQDKDRIICRKDTVTGSRSQARRTCLTAREWERVGAATRSDVDDYLRRNTAGAPRGS